MHPDPAIASSSFDLRLDDLMERKRALSRGLLLPPESDDDVEDLLSNVLDGRPDEGPADAEAIAAEPGAPDPTPEATESGVKEDHLAATSEALSPGPPAARPILTLRPTPIEAAERRANEIRRVEFEQYGTRNWAIFDQYIDGASISRLEIQDPYCCADDAARGRLVNFVKRFEEKADKLARVEVLAFDADSIETRQPESTRDQREQLERRWQTGLSEVDLKLTQRSRRAKGDLHDRFVRAHLASGDTIIWDLGRGIDGVMNAKWSCVVNAFHQPASSPYVR
jgi:hypothetical protein